MGDRTHASDDFWELSEARVFLVAEPAPTRTFLSTGTARLGNEFGHTVWLGDGARDDE
jgi:hypothetical protein